MKHPRRRFLQATGAIALGSGAAQYWPRSSATTFETVHVGTEQEYETIQEGVDAANPGDLVLIHKGKYPEQVHVTTPRITIRGVDRNNVEIDGDKERKYGIYITADLVAVENLRVHHCSHTAVYWKGVEGFRGCYLTAHNNGEYGVYAYDSFDGRFEHSYASANADAGFYLGHRNPFHALITEVVAEGNGIGYSGTAAGGDLRIEDSTWKHNWAGIVPNTLHPNEPQRSSKIVGNVVRDNNNTDAPALSLQQTALGSGILLVGASQNDIKRNEVQKHENFGIAIIPSAPAETVSKNNLVQKNTVQKSFDDVAEVTVDPDTAADLGLGAPTGPGNRFVNNTFDTSLPENIERGVSEGSELVSGVYQRQQRMPLDPGDWKTYKTGNETGRVGLPDEKIHAEPIPARKQYSCDELG
jgi:hypothetical protein